MLTPLDPNTPPRKVRVTRPFWNLDKNGARYVVEAGQVVTLDAMTAANVVCALRGVYVD